MAETLDDPRRSLAAAYDAAADERELGSVAPWKADERARFLSRLQAEGAATLLELGAGTGVHGRWFADQGLAVTATDLSAVMVEHCRAKGLTALQMDMQSLAFAEPFDAVFAMNCLLHVPNAQLPMVLARIAGALRPGALAFLGQWSGPDEEGPWAGDNYAPKRFFSFRSDEALKRALAQHFAVVDFRTEPHGGRDGLAFQAATLRRL
jgi:2-polyprenyl-3-methyl-5-hydroxy-6-metoxy-1,4-benzoquinol methylase